MGVWGFRATLYEGEGGALRGALLPIMVFLAVKVTGEAALARWDRALVGVWLCRGAAELRVLTVYRGLCRDLLFAAGLAVPAKGLHGWRKLPSAEFGKVVKAGSVKASVLLVNDS